MRFTAQRTSKEILQTKKADPFGIGFFVANFFLISLLQPSSMGLVDTPEPYKPYDAWNESK